MEYKQRFETIGQEIANTLSFFSLDLCGLICKYAIYGKCSPGKQEIFFNGFQLSIRQIAQILHNPIMNTLIVRTSADYHTIYEFNINGTFIGRNHLICNDIHFHCTDMAISNQKIWFSTGNPQIFISNIHTLVKPFKRKLFNISFLHPPYISRLVYFNEKYLAIRCGFQNTLYFIDMDKETLLKTMPMPTDQFVIHSQGNVSFIKDKTLDQIDFQTNKLIRTQYLNTGLVSAKITCMCIDKYDQSFVVFEDPFMPDFTLIQVFSSEGKAIADFTLDCSCTCIHIDLQNRIWIGNKKGYVNVYGFEI